MSLSLFSYDIVQPDSQVHLHWKGAAEIVLASCTTYIDENDNVVPMTEDKVCEKLFLTSTVSCCNI